LPPLDLCDCCIDVVITEGPHPIGPRRIALFIRDPDGNVLEFNQLIRGGAQ